MGTTKLSVNLDFLRSIAVLLVVGFHLAKFFNWRLDVLRLTDFGLLGVMLFFVHTTLVLMFSLERQSTEKRGSLFLPFMVRRCFRIYPLAMLVVSAVYFLQIPSDLRWGGIDLFHQTSVNFMSNLLLIQNVTGQKSNPGVLWTLPIELQMYIALPALFLFAVRARSIKVVLLLWFAITGAWLAIGSACGILPLKDGGFQSPLELLLKVTRFVPCFLPGVIAYKLWTRHRSWSATRWPVYLLACCAGFVLIPGNDPVEKGWLVCFIIGCGVSYFRDLPQNRLTYVFKHIAQYSYGIYLLHQFAIWVGFVVCSRVPVSVQASVFVITLICLSAGLYYTVEAPLIKLGVRLSEYLTLDSLLSDRETSISESRTF